MKNFTTTIIASSLFAVSMFSVNAMANETSPSTSQLLNAVNVSLTSQAQVMLQDAKTEIMASLQRELSQSITAVTDELVQQTMASLTEIASGTAIEVAARQ